jgi:GNAT superfamily N-acetyltransferase
MSDPISVVVQQVAEPQLPDFFRLVDGLADYEKLARPNDEARARLARDCQGPNRRIDAYLAIAERESGPEAVGYIILLETYSSFLAMPTLYIEDIFVDPDSRGHGAGRTLLAHAVAEARRRGCGRVEFLVLDWNRLARDFYEKAGATHLNDWVAYRIPSEDFDAVTGSLGVTGPSSGNNLS